MTEIETKRVALHDGTRVVNVIIVPAAWTGRRKIDVPVPEGLTALESDTAGADWLVVDGVLTPPAPSVPA